ncbi:MAG: nicotinate-nucleotide adenylyltransferase, partial [Bryobacteraceae bacterium]
MNLALYGGTFDPIHRAHLIVAGEAAEQFKLEAVWFVTAGQPPHKPAGGTTPYEHRQRMVELACAGDPRFHSPRLEQTAGASYTIRTIQRVRARLQPDDRLFFLIGADAFAEIGTWYHAAEVLAAVEFIVVSRRGYVYPVPAGARIHRLETLALPVSSSEIRRTLEQG